MAVARNVTKSNVKVLPDLSNVIPANGTKELVSRSGKASVDFKDPLTTQLMEVFDPLITALDDKPALLMEASADNGQESPSMQDMGMKILLGTFLSFLHRQNHGPIRIPMKDQRTGKVLPGQFRELPCNKERMDDSQKRLTDITDLNDPEAYKTLYYASVNEERFRSLEALRHSFAMVHREIFREDWKPIDQVNAVTKVPVDMSKVDESEKNKWAERLKNMKAA